MNWTNLRESCRGSRHLLMALVLAIVIIASTDFFDRIFVPRDDSLRRFNTPVVVKVGAPPTTESILQRVTEWVPEPTVQIVGKPREIALQAIFSQRGKAEAFVVLLADADRPEERLKVAVDAEVDGWRVQSISRTRVILKKGDEQRELIIFRGKVE